MFDINNPYKEDKKLKFVIKYLSLQESIINLEELVDLRTKLLQVSQGESYLIQLGDCAERFFVPNELDALKKQQFAELGKILEKKTKIPSLVVGRVAGQYAKPRTSIYDSDNKTLSYFGDIVNGVSVKLRSPNANRMLVAYRKSKKTLNVLKSLRDFYISHECLILPYEKALTRNVFDYKVNVSAHVLWLGAKSWNNQELINYLSSIYNPIAVKLSSHITSINLRNLLLKLNPENISGKIILIARIGLNKTKQVFTSWLRVVDDLEFDVVWLVDPMHANTKYDQYGVKYRLIGEMQQEYKLINDVFYEKNGYNVGMHLEASPLLDLEECVFALDGKKRLYTSPVDPRLNGAQVKDFIDGVL
jgi:3-deoxy-7-phosphoheptulonate synthase